MHLNEFLQPVDDSEDDDDDKEDDPASEEDAEEVVEVDAEASDSEAVPSPLTSLPEDTLSVVAEPS